MSERHFGCRWGARRVQCGSHRSRLVSSGSRPWCGRWPATPISNFGFRSEEHTSELQSQSNLVCRLLLEKKNSALDAIDAVFPLPRRTVPTSAKDDPSFAIQPNLVLPTETLNAPFRPRVPHATFLSSRRT